MTLERTEKKTDHNYMQQSTEVELGVILNGVKANEGSWMDRIGAYVLLLDMGDFSMIKAAIANGHSWTISK